MKFDMFPSILQTGALQPLKGGKHLKNLFSFTRDSYKGVLLSFSYVVYTKKQKALHAGRKHETTKVLIKQDTSTNTGNLRDSRVSIHYYCLVCYKINLVTLSH